MKPAPEGIDQMLDEGLGLELISLRLDKDLLAKVKTEAEHQGIVHQALIRKILRQYIRGARRRARRRK